MVITIPQIIAAINPKIYNEGSAKEIEKIRNSNEDNVRGILEAAKATKPRALKVFDKDGDVKVDIVSGFEISHQLTYDSPTETLEPIYFFITELMEDLGIKTEKMVDNFSSSPGSTHFGEMGQRASIMQQNGSKLLGDINTVLRSIMTIVYDLRDFKIRLKAYEDLEDKDEDTKKAAKLSLKQVWMDKVDIQKGNSSIKNMAFSQAGFSTLLDAFLVCDNEKDVDKIDLNAIVRRVLKPRIQEFNHWIKFSGSELNKRFTIEKEYLRSQVHSLRTYINWAKPYLKAADDLRMSDNGRNPALVKMFNTIVLQLTLLGKKKKGDFNEIVLVDFDFRGIPQKTQQGYSAGGKTVINFKGYALTDDEMKLLYEAFDKSEVNEGLKLIEGMTDDSLGALSEDIDFFLEDKEPEKGKGKGDKKKAKSTDMSNPFLALFGFYNDKGAPKKKFGKKKIKKIGNSTGEDVKEMVYKIFSTYKKAHGMLAWPD